MASLALIDLNTLIHHELSRQINSISGPERDSLSVPDYQPFNEVRALVTIHRQPETFLDQIKKRLPRFFSQADPFAEYLKNAKRRS